MARADLRALTDDGLTQLSNAGTVKRAQRDMAGGQGPDVTVAKDGTIEARFADGTLTRLAAGRDLADASCTCPSSGVCRHRIMLAMACREIGTEDDGGDAQDDEGWNPATLDLDAFEVRLSPPTRAELTRLLNARHTIRLDHGKVPAARLPMASVRFLVPHDLGYARCDCAQGRDCSHVALAIRAFRAADGASETVVGGTTETAETIDTSALALACETLLAHLLDVGLTAGMAAHELHVERVKRFAETLDASQILLVIEALAEQITAYEARSARHDELVALRLAVELVARTKTTETAMALGLGEPFETAMSKSRLVSLGARLRQEGPDIRASVLLVDSDTSAVMLMEKLFSPQPNESERFHASVLRRQFAPGLAVAGVGRGQVLTSVAKRRADGLLALGSGAGGRTQVMPRDGNFSFAAPLMARDVNRIVDDFSERPISLIRPHRRIDDVHVFEVVDILGQSWSAGAQFWEAAVRLANDGGTLYLKREFDAAAPAASAILAAAFAGRWGGIRQIAGPVRLEEGALVCEPWSISADRFIVPDIDTADGDVSLPTPHTAWRSPGLLDELERLLAGAVHAGSRARHSYEAIGKPLKTRLATAGYATLATRLGHWLASAPGSGETAFGELALWLLTLRETWASETR